MPAAKPMTAGSSQPRFLSNRGRCAAAKAMGASRWSAACTGAAAMFYIVNESLSILENAVLLGVPVPQKLTQALDVAKWTSNSEKEEPQNEKQDE